MLRQIRVLPMQGSRLLAARAVAFYKPTIILVYGSLLSVPFERKTVSHYLHPMLNMLIRYFTRKKTDSVKDNFFDKDVAFESEYYYRQDPQLLKILKQKTEEEVAAMQDKVRAMNAKIDEYNRDISETVRFLKSLEKDLSAGTKKKT